MKILAGPALGAIVFVLFPESGVIAGAAGIVVWMAAWWITEAVTIYFTALLPLVLFPLLGIMPMSDVAPQYTKDIIFLFVGGFFIAFGLERWNLHRRIALKLILLVGSTPAGILAGFMLASYALSMWISNTAAVTMLLPAALAVIQQIEEYHERKKSRVAKPLLIGLAYASSIGGMSTIVGTPPNLIFMSFFNERYPDSQVNFANWFAFGFPLSILLLGVCFGVLWLMYHNDFRGEAVGIDVCRAAYGKLGPMRYEERVLSAMFGMTVLLWFFLKDLTIGSLTIPGWTSLPPFAGYAEYINESTVAMLMACLMYVYPSRAEPGGLLRWSDLQRLPLGVIFLFGGGFALARGLETSGLSVWLSEGLAGLDQFPPFALVLSLCLFVTFLTELTSNAATTLLILPIIYSLASSVPVEPILVFIPVVLSASCAFMLPVATPPNTIVFGSERLDIRDMVRTGLWMNLAGAVLITLATFTIVRAVF